MPERPLRVVLLAPYLNGDGLGEAYSVFNWTQALAEITDLTVLSIVGKQDLAAQLPKARVVTISDPSLLMGSLTRFNAMAKPWLPFYFRWARRWIKAAMGRGEAFDIAHQILPQAMRYASPLAGLGLPYVIGPLGGSLETPKGFVHEVRGGGIYTRLRTLDRPRLRYDPRLRKGYEEAALILGVAPYIAETFREANLGIQRFEPVLERGHDGRLPLIERTSGVGEAHLLHVGRGIRTKGLRDVIRAMALLKDLPGVQLTSAGDGEDMDACKNEARQLGVAERVTFLGRVPRDEVDRLYAAADIFCFPSFREPMGGVFFEAMEFGLPVITAARGGPDFIIDETCGLRLPVETPDQFTRAIAEAIRALAMEPERRRQLGAGSQARLQTFGGWPEKARHLDELYRSILSTGFRSGYKSG
ncbi:MAG: glycosyltransferase family 4 protein [Pseudomonadota bacterium]